MWRPKLPVSVGWLADGFSSRRPKASSDPMKETRNEELGVGFFAIMNW